MFVVGVFKCCRFLYSWKLQESIEQFTYVQLFLLTSCALAIIKNLRLTCLLLRINLFLRAMFRKTVSMSLSWRRLLLIRMRKDYHSCAS